MDGWRLYFASLLGTVTGLGLALLASDHGMPMLSAIGSLSVTAIWLNYAWQARKRAAGD